MLNRLVHKVLRRVRSSRLFVRHVPTRAWKVSCFGKMKPLPRSLYEWILGVKPISMLHVETLMGLYQFTLLSEGMILEVGPYIGGSTIVLAKALQQWKASRQPGSDSRRLITIEVGGANPQHTYVPSADILADLQANLRRYDVQDEVEVVQGWAYEPHVVSIVAEAAGKQPIGLIILDANGTIKADLKRFGPYCRPSCYVVCDDYVEMTGDIKSVYVKPEVDQLVQEGKLETLGILPWGTWFGRMLSAPR
jgi:predicted O-methyltransferase YrrM